MNQQPVPYCVKFLPSDADIFDTFLNPHIQHTLDLNRSLVFSLNSFFSTGPEQHGLPANFSSPYYPRSGSYWFLVQRPPAMFASDRYLKLGQRTLGNNMGVWKQQSGKEKEINLVEGNRKLGTKKLFKFFYKDVETSELLRRQTGYSLFEYALPLPTNAIPQAPGDALPQVEPMVVLNVVYTFRDDAYRHSLQPVPLPQPPPQVALPQPPLVDNDNGDGQEENQQEENQQEVINDEVIIEQATPYYCLKFDPSDVEVFQMFLNPYIQYELDMTRSLMFDSEFFHSSPHQLVSQGNFSSHLYPRRGLHWFLVERQASVFASKRFRTLVDNDIGVWKQASGKEKEQSVLSGGDKLGTRRLFRFFYNDPDTSKVVKLSTGWSLYEYELPSDDDPEAQGDPLPQVEQTVALKMWYTFAEDEYASTQTPLPEDVEDNNGDEQEVENHDVEQVQGLNDGEEPVIEVLQVQQQVMNGVEVIVELNNNGPDPVIEEVEAENPNVDQEPVIHEGVPAMAGQVQLINGGPEAEEVANLVANFYNEEQAPLE